MTDVKKQGTAASEQSAQDKLHLKEIGHRIRTQREIMRYTREDLGRKIGVTGKFIADIEGGVKGMSLQTLNKLANSLHLSADFILGRDSSGGPDESQERKQIKENIMATLSTCDVENLYCFEQIARYFVNGAVLKDK